MIARGITGRSGCGKSTVTAVFSAHGVPLADADQLSREILLPGSPLLPQLAARFGGEILKPDGTLDRRLLADRAFATPEGTAALTDMTQPEILRRIDAALAAARQGGADHALEAGADIVGTPYAPHSGAQLLPPAPKETSVARICARDGIAPEMARRRLDAQPPLETLRAAATAELVNDSTPDALREKLRSVLNGLEKEGTCQKPKSEIEAF